MANPNHSRAYLADDRGDSRPRAENHERDTARGLSDRPAGDDLCQLSNQDRVDGDHRDRQYHEGCVRKRLAVADRRRPALVDEGGEPTGEADGEQEPHAARDRTGRLRPAHARVEPVRVVCLVFGIA